MSIHIATSMELARVVQEGLRVSVQFVPENWMIGPWPQDLGRLPRARCDFFSLEGRERTKALADYRSILRAIAADEKITVWMSRLGNDTLAFWALCAWRQEKFLNRPNMSLVVMGGPTEAEEPLGVGPGFIQSTPDDALRMMKRARELSPTRVRRVATLWRRVTAPVPILAEKINPSTLDSRRLQQLGLHQAAFLPRLGRHGIRLSHFDELLFKNIAKHASTPVDVVVHSGKRGEEMRQWMSITGDLFIAKRLQQWACRGGPRAALTSEPYRPDRAMLAARYQLSEVGRQILRKGLRDMSEGAPLPFWGITAYDPQSPWAFDEKDKHAILLANR